MHVHFVKTQSVQDNLYIDLLAIDGKPITFAMEKISEPNVFGVKEQVEGDKFSEFVEKYKT